MTKHHNTQHGSEAGVRSGGQSKGGDEVIEGDLRREEERTRRGKDRVKRKTDTGKSNGIGEEMKERQQCFQNPSTQQFQFL